MNAVKCLENIALQHLFIPMGNELSGSLKDAKHLRTFGDCRGGLISCCLARISNCLEEGNLLIADELDAKLHPKLLRYLIGLFTNPKSNKKGAQLLLTSHDITTMNHDVFRRDEIWFCAKNPYGASKLYSLASFRKNDGTMIRNDEAYGKRYIEGRYGADPYIQRIMSWEDGE